jgi:hypothetical protein
MINIAQDNDTTPVELDKLFTQEEQRALEARGFLGPVVEKAPTPAPTLIQDLGATIMAHLEALIDERVNELVEEKVAAIMSSHATIALISQEQRNMMEEMVSDAIDVHLSDIDHDGFCTREQAEEIVSDIDMESVVKRAIGHSNIVEDIVETALDDIDWGDKVRQGLNEIL